jgi:hypothetical protein
MKKKAPPPFRIDKGIPMPRRHRDHREVRRMLALLPSIGDSFLVPSEPEDHGDERRKLHALRMALFNYAKQHGGKFTVQAVEGGWRIWRIA